MVAEDWALKLFDGFENEEGGPCWDRVSKKKDKRGRN